MDFPSIKKTTSANVGLFIIFLMFTIRLDTASLLISFSSNFPISNMQISLSHLQPSKPPKINNYLVPITQAVCLYLPVGAFSLSTGWLHLMVSVLRTYKSLEGIIFLKDLPLPSYPPKRYILFPIKLAV